MKFGMIGAGRWAENYARTISELSGLEISSVLRLQKKQPSWLPDAELYTDRDEFMSLRGELDGIIVASSNPARDALAVASMQLPMMVEKPVMESLDGIDKVLVNYVHLFSPAFLEMREILCGKKILSINSEGHNQGPWREEFSALWDYGPHDLSMILSLAGLPRRANVLRLQGGFTSSLYQLMLNYDGFNAHSLVGNGAQKRARLLEVVYLDGDKGRKLVYDDTIEKKLTLDDERVIIPTTQPLRNAVRAFTRLIDGEEDWRFGQVLTGQIQGILGSL